jgi:tetratricopeptide (TPR) repeat protein
MLIEASRQKMLGNWAEATVLYHDAITVDPENDAAHFELAKIHAMQGQFDDALNCTNGSEAVPAKSILPLCPGRYLCAFQ